MKKPSFRPPRNPMLLGGDDKNNILILTEPRKRICRTCGMEFYGTEFVCEFCRKKKPPIIYDD